MRGYPPFEVAKPRNITAISAVIIRVLYINRDALDYLFKLLSGRTVSPKLRVIQ